MLRSSLLFTTAILGLVSARVIAADDAAERTRQWVAVLESDAPLFDKARACQQLGESGGPEAIPALAAWLADEHLSAYARSGLEGIPDPRAAEALRAAAARLEGARLAGVVNSLGVLRDAQAVALLRQLAAAPEQGVQAEALRALGRIATVEAVATVVGALNGATSPIREAAAAGCLLAAEQRLAAGDAAMATLLYDGLRSAEVPMPYRAAATRGAILARGDAGVPILIEQLRSSEPAFRQVALTTVREQPSEALADALNEAVGRSPAAQRVDLLKALLDCHNAQSVKVAEALAVEGTPAVRQTALAVVGVLGGASAVDVLLEAVQAARSPEEVEIALQSLRGLEGPEVDTRIVRALGATKATGARVELARLLEARRATGAVAELMRQADDADPQAAVAALRALESLAGANDLAHLIQITRRASDDARRQAAENAVSGVCVRTGRVSEGCQAVLAELARTEEPLNRQAWIRILVTLGDPSGLPAVLNAARDALPAVAGCALEELSRWPDPAPVEPLLQILRSTREPTQQKRALDSVLRLVTAAADERQRPADVLLGWMQQLNPLVQSTDDRRRLISALGRVPESGSLRMLRPYLSDVDVQSEAAVAILQIAPDLPARDTAALREALTEISAKAGSAELRSQAAELNATLAR